MLFVIVATFLAPITAIGELIRNKDNQTVVIVNLVIATLSLYTGILLWTLSPKALKMVKVYLIVHGAKLLMMLSGFWTVNDLTVGGNSTQVIFSRLTYLGCWALYFHKSERVLATYGENLNL